MEEDGLYCRFARRRVGHLEGMPFFIEDDGSYSTHLNRWLRTLPNRGALAPNTWKAYAHDVLSWVRHLRDRNVASVWEAEQEDYIAYHAARIRGLGAVSRSTWNRSNAALESLYTWGQGQGLIDKPPLVYKTVVAGFGGERRQVNATYRPAKTAPVSFLVRKEFDLWLRSGMRLVGPDVPANSHSIRLYTSLVYVMVTTALRKNEALVLLKHEPGMPGAEGQLHIPAMLRKRGARGVDPVLATRVRKLIEDYSTLERPEAVERGRDVLWDIDRPEFARVVGNDGTFEFLSSGRRVHAHRIDRATRRRLVLVDGDGSPAEPALLFLASNTGKPLEGGTAVYKRFAAANKRLASLGHDVRVIPHDLRHTYAVHRLNQLIQEAAKKYPGNVDMEFLRDVAATEPLRILQDELGHTAFTSVLRYLRPKASRDAFDWQVEVWDPGREDG